jgi:hypothetical protein
MSGIGADHIGIMKMCRGSKSIPINEEDLKTQVREEVRQSVLREVQSDAAKAEEVSGDELNESKSRALCFLGIVVVVIVLIVGLVVGLGGEEKYLLCRVPKIKPKSLSVLPPSYPRWPEPADWR